MSIMQAGTLTGTITSKTGALVGEMSKPVGYTNYTGDYTVVPKVTEQVLPTKDKRMIDNVTVKEVPVYKVSNNAGGITVYIARERNNE